MYLYINIFVYFCIKYHFLNTMNLYTCIFVYFYICIFLYLYFYIFIFLYFYIIRSLYFYIFIFLYFYIFIFLYISIFNFLRFYISTFLYFYIFEYLYFIFSYCHILYFNLPLCPVSCFATIKAIVFQVPGESPGDRAARRACTAAPSREGRLIISGSGYISKFGLTMA